MNYLKAILYGTFVVLIMTLLLTNMRWCRPNPIPLSTIIEEPIQQEEPVEEPQTDTLRGAEEARQIGGSGDLKITLLWDYYADMDLHVTQPNNQTIYYSSPRDNSTGGFLDVDDRTGGNNAAENIYWNNPPSGNYSVSLHYYGRGTNGGNSTQSGVCKIYIFWKGQLIQAHSVPMSQVGDKKLVTNISIP